MVNIIIHICFLNIALQADVEAVQAIRDEAPFSIWVNCSKSFARL